MDWKGWIIAAVAFGLALSKRVNILIILGLAGLAGYFCIGKKASLIRSAILAWYLLSGLEDLPTDDARHMPATDATPQRVPRYF